MPRGVNPSVWGMDAISSSCELILRTLVIDDHLLRFGGLVLRKKQPATRPIGQRRATDLQPWSTGPGVGGHPPRWSGRSLVERDGCRGADSSGASCLITESLFANANCSSVPSYVPPVRCPKLDAIGVRALYEAVDRLAVEHRATLGVAVREEHAQVEVIEVHLAKVLIPRSPQTVDAASEGRAPAVYALMSRPKLAVDVPPAPRARADLCRPAPALGRGRSPVSRPGRTTSKISGTAFTCSGAGVDDDFNRCAITRELWTSLYGFQRAMPESPCLFGWPVG